MLKDPLPLAVFNVAAGIDGSNTNLSLRDLSDGRTVRVNGTDIIDSTKNGRTVLTISHSVSKENANQLTDRSAVRLEVRRTLETGVESVAQVTMTTSLPRLGFGPADVEQLAKSLVATLLAPVSLDGESSNLTMVGDNGPSRLSVVLAGEP